MYLSREALWGQIKNVALHTHLMSNAYILSSSWPYLSLQPNRLQRAGCVLKFMTFLFDSASSRGTIVHTSRHHDVSRSDVTSQKLHSKK